MYSIMQHGSDILSVVERREVPLVWITRQIHQLVELGAKYTGELMLILSQ